MRLIAASFIDYITRSSFDFIINPGDVMSDDTEADHKYASDNQFQKDNGSETFKGCSVKITVQGMDAKNN